MRQHIVHGLNRENDRLGDNHLPFMYIVQRPSIEQSTPLWIPNDHQSIHPWFNIILAVFKKQYCQKHWEHLHLVYIVPLVDGMGGWDILVVLTPLFSTEVSVQWIQWNQFSVDAISCANRSITCVIASVTNHQSHQRGTVGHSLKALLCWISRKHFLDHFWSSFSIA